MSAPVARQIGGLKLVLMDPAGAGVVVPSSPQNAADIFSQHAEVQAAIDGPMFGFCENTPRSYASYSCGRVDYLLLDIWRNVSVSGQSGYASRGVTFSVVNGRMTAARGRSVAQGASVAFQCYPGLVENGSIAVRRKDDGPDTQRVGRVAVGLMQDGSMFFAYAATSMYEFAEMLRSAGALWAGYTDGGGSSSLVVRGSDGALYGSDSDDPRGRRVPSWIVWSDPRSGVTANRPGMPPPSYDVASPQRTSIATPETRGEARAQQSGLEVIVKPSAAVPVAVLAAAVLAIAVALYYRRKS
jgi:hypothetical protein